MLQHQQGHQKCAPISGELCLNPYVPLNDGSHQRLGISLEGLLCIFERIGLIHKLEGEEIANTRKQINQTNFRDCISKLPLNTSGMCIYDWQYESSYQRSDNEEWLDELYGEIEQGGEESATHNGTKNFVGYDAVHFIRRWLVANEYEDLSLCEVILLDKRFVDLRGHIGQANVFWSHRQEEPLLAEGTVAHIAQVQMEQEALLDDSAVNSWVRLFSCTKNKTRLPPAAEQRFWLDYTSLRQMRRDFDVGQIVEIIKSTCVLVASVDCYSLKYCTRSFCLFEAFAAVVAIEASTEGCSLLVYNTEGFEGNAPFADQCNFHASRIVTSRRLASKPIDSASASTRNEEDKQKIDAFISRTIGFKELDDAITEAAM